MPIREQARQILSDHRWHTGLEICSRVGKRYGTGVMSKVRDLRKPEHGSCIIESRRNLALSRRYNVQVWEYRML